MSGKSKRPENGPLSRAAFLSWLKDQANPKKFAREYGGLLGLFTGSGALLEPGRKWKYVCTVEEAGKPRVVFTGTQPVYVIAVGTAVNAYRSRCPEDDGFVTWSEGREGFHCPLCDTVYGPDGTAVRSGKVLESWPCRVKDGKVYVLAQSS